MFRGAKRVFRGAKRVFRGAKRVCLGGAKRVGLGGPKDLVYSLVIKVSTFRIASTAHNNRGNKAVMATCFPMIICFLPRL